MENKYYFIQEPFEDGFIIPESELPAAKEYFNQEIADCMECSFEDYFNFSEVLAYDINNDLFINADGDTVYFCHKSGAYWFVQLYGTPEEAAEYQTELFRAKNYCG